MSEKQDAITLGMDMQAMGDGENPAGGGGGVGGVGGGGGGEGDHCFDGVNHAARVAAECLGNGLGEDDALAAGLAHGLDGDLNNGGDDNDGMEDGMDEGMDEGMEERMDEGMDEAMRGRSMKQIGNADQQVENKNGYYVYYNKLLSLFFIYLYFLFSLYYKCCLL